MLRPTPSAKLPVRLLARIAAAVRLNNQTLQGKAVRVGRLSGYKYSKKCYAWAEI